MNQFSQRIITICVIIITLFSILSFAKICKIYETTQYHTDVLDNIDLNLIRTFDKVYSIYLQG